MAKEIRVPRLGWSMEEGVLVRWLKQPGEKVAEEEPLFELEGEKAVQEIGSLDAGTLYLTPDSPAIGSTVLVGALLGYLLAPGEAALTSEASGDSRSGAVSPISDAKPVKPTLAAPAGPAARRLARKLNKHPTETAAAPRPTNGAIHSSSPRPAARDAVASVASPRARRVAAELGVDWTRLAGTGRDGRVREADVRAASTDVETSPASQPAQGENVLTPRRKAIAQRLRHSRSATVPVTLTTTADVTNLVALRAQFKSAAAGAVPAYTDFVASLVARMLRRHPDRNR